MKRAAESCDWVQKKILEKLAARFAGAHTCIDLWNGLFYEGGGSDKRVAPSILCAADKRVSVQVLKDERKNEFCRLCFNKE